MSEYKIKPWEELTIQDDYMFKLVMRNKKLCRQMLERILRLKIKFIKFLEEEKTIKSGYFSKGVRLDVYLADGNGTVISVELQVRRLSGDILYKRMRYYQSMIDADLLAAGVDYDELNQTYIIFICPFPVLGGERHMYTFRHTCEEDKSIILPDGATKIILSTKGKMNDIPADLQTFLDYVDGKMSNDSFVQEIDDTINELKKIEAERMVYMTFAMKLRDEYKVGREEGLKEGFEDAENRYSQLLTRLIADGRTDEVSKVAANKMRRHELYLQYGIN